MFFDSEMLSYAIVRQSITVSFSCFRKLQFMNLYPVRNISARVLDEVIRYDSVPGNSTEYFSKTFQAITA